MISAIGPAITLNYGNLGLWCWILKEGELSVPYLGITEQILFFYVPIVISIAYIIRVSIKVQIRLNTLKQDFLRSSSTAASSIPHKLAQKVCVHQPKLHSSSQIKSLERLRLYPLILIATFAIPLADRMFYNITQQDIPLLTFLHALTIGLLGAMHALVYFQSSKVQGKIKSKWFGFPEDEPETMYVTSPSYEPEKEHLLQSSTMSTGECGNRKLY